MLIIVCSFVSCAVAMLIAFASYSKGYDDGCEDVHRNMEARDAA